jgi:hypothetical protein
MQVFYILIAGLAVFAALIFYFSWWTAFGIVYMLSMLLVALVALFKRSRRQSA